MRKTIVSNLKSFIAIILTLSILFFQYSSHLNVVKAAEHKDVKAFALKDELKRSWNVGSVVGRDQKIILGRKADNSTGALKPYGDSEEQSWYISNVSDNKLQLFSTGTNYKALFNEKGVGQVTDANRWNTSKAREWLNGTYKNTYFRGNESNILCETDVTTNAEIGITGGSIIKEQKTKDYFYLPIAQRYDEKGNDKYNLSSDIAGDITKNIIPKKYWVEEDNWSRTPASTTAGGGSNYTLYYNKAGIGLKGDMVSAASANTIHSGNGGLYKFSPLTNIDTTNIIFASSAIAGESAVLKAAKDGMYLKLKSENYGKDNDFKIYNENIYTNGNNMYVKYTNAKAGDYITICITDSKANSYTASFRVEKTVNDNNYGIAHFDISNLKGTEFTTRVWCETPSGEGSVNTVSNVHIFTEALEDNESPTIQHISTNAIGDTAEGNGWYNGEVEIVVKVTDERSGVNPDTVKMKVDNKGEERSPTAIDYTNDLYTFNFDASQSGEFGIYVTATDFVGNKTAYTNINTVKIDKANPIIEKTELVQVNDMMKAKIMVKDDLSGLDRVEVTKVDSNGTATEEVKTYKPDNDYPAEFEFSFDINANELIDAVSYKIKAYDAVTNNVELLKTFKIEKSKIEVLKIENEDNWAQEKNVTFQLKTEDGNDLGYQVETEKIKVRGPDGNEYEVTKLEDGENKFSFKADKIGGYNITAEYLNGIFAEANVDINKINNTDPKVEFASLNPFIPTNGEVTLSFNVELGEEQCPVKEVKVYRKGPNGDYVDITKELTINKPQGTKGGLYSFNTPKNGEYKFEIIDESGRKGEATAKIDNIYGMFEIKDVDVEYLGLGVSKVTMKRPEEVKSPNKIDSARITINGVTIDMKKVPTGAGENDYEFVAKQVPYSGDFTINAEDTAGNMASYTGKIGVHPPEIKNVSISNENAWTRTKKLTFRVEDADGEAVAASVTGINNEDLKRTSTGENYAEFECEITENGDYTIEASDNSGRKAEPITKKVDKIDRKAPHMIGNVEYDHGFTNGNIEVTVTVEDEESGMPNNGGLILKYTEDGEEKTLAPTSSENVVDSHQKRYNFTISNNGTYTPHAVDAVGNEIDLKNFAITNIDRTAPTIKINSVGTITESGKQKKRVVFTVADSQSRVNEGRISVSKKNEPNTTKEVKKTSDGSAYYFDVDAEEGDTIYIINAEDNAGNKSNVESIIEWTVPIIGEPSITPNGWAREKTVKFRVTSEAGVSKDSIYYLYGAQASKEGLVVEGAETNFAVSLPASLEGDYTLFVMDKSGNTANKAALVKMIDKEAPTIVSHEITNMDGNKIDSQTNEDVYLVVELKDTQSGVNPGTVVLGDARAENLGGNKFRFRIRENGSYQLKAEDNVGNRFEGTADNGGLINVNLIDKGRPIISKDPTKVEAIVGEHKKKVYFTVTNEGVSEVDRNSLEVKNEDGQNITVIDAGNTNTYYFELTQGGTFKINAKNTVGTSAEERTYTIEFIPPVISNVAVTPNGWSKSKRINFNVTDGEGSGINSVEVYLDNTKKGDAIKGDGDAYYFDVEDELDDIGKSYKIVAKDRNANEANVDMQVSKIDRSAPQINNISQTPAAGTFTNKNVTVTFSAVDNLSGVDEGKVLFKLEGDDAWRLSSKGTGNTWSFEATRNGKYYVKVFDNVGNVNDTYAQDNNPLIQINNIDKDLPIISNFEITSADSTKKTVQFEVNAASGIKEVTLKNELGTLITLNDISSGNKTKFEFTDNAGGNHVYKVTATSNAENTATKEQTIEWSNPEIKEITITPIGKEINGYAKSRKVTAVVSDETEIKEVKATLNGKEINLTREGNPKDDPNNDGKKLYTFSFEAKEEGDYEIVATDLAGNTSESKTAKVEKLDKTAPTINSHALYDAVNGTRLDNDPKVWTKNNVKIKLNVADNESGVGRVLISKTGADLVPAILDNGEYVFEVNENGTYYVMAIDALGNSTNLNGYEVEVLHIDRDAPYESEYQVTNDAGNDQKTIKFKLSDSQSGVNTNTVKYKIDNGEEQRCTKDDDGFYTITVQKPNGNNSETTLNITIKAADNAENEVTLQKSITWNNPVIKNIEVLPNKDVWSKEKEIRVHVESSIPMLKVKAENNSNSNDTIDFSYSNTYQSGGKDIFVYRTKYEDELDSIGKTYNIVATDESNNNSASDSNVTLKKIDKTAPTINVSLKSKDGNNLEANPGVPWAKDDVTIKAAVSDAGSGIKKLEYKAPGEDKWRECAFPAGKKEGDNNIEYAIIADTKGTYTLRTTDMVENSSNEKTIEINIDRDEVIIDNFKIAENQTNPNKVDITFSVKAGDSGVKEVTAKIGNSDTTVRDNGDGTYTITVNKGTSTPYTINAASNSGMQGEVTRNFDWAPPIVEIESVTDENNWAKSKMVFVRAYDNDGDDVTLQVSRTNGTGEITVIPLEGQRYSFIATENDTYKVVATDDYGNTAEVTKQIDKIDHTSPKIKAGSVKIEAAAGATTYTKGGKTYIGGKAKVSFTLVDSESGVNKDSVVLLNGADKSQVVMNIEDGAANGEVDVTFETDKNGTYELTSSDNVGNEMKDTDSIKIGVDGSTVYISNSKPKVDLISKNPPNWTNGNVTITINASDDVTGIKAGSVEYSLDNSTWQSCNAAEGNKYSFAASNNGTYYVRAANNLDISSDILEVKVDNIDKVNPTINIEDIIANGTSKTVIFKANDELSGVNVGAVKVSYNERELKVSDGSLTYNDETKEFSFTIDKDDDGEIDVTINAEDNAGNAASVLAKLEWFLPVIKSIDVSPVGDEVNGYAKERKITVKVSDESEVNEVIADLDGEVFRLSKDNNLNADPDPDNSKKYIYTFSLTTDTMGTYEIVAYDINDNASDSTKDPHQAIVENIDNTPPAIEEYFVYVEDNTDQPLNGKEKMWTSGLVIVELDVIDVESGVKEVLYSEDRLSWKALDFDSDIGKYTFKSSENKTYYIKTTDNLGNSSNGEDEIHLNYIDKTPPRLVSYNVALGKDNKINLTIKVQDDESGILDIMYSMNPDRDFRSIGQKFNVGSNIVETNFELNEEGIYYLKTIDAAGNVSIEKIEVNLEHDAENFANTSKTGDGLKSIIISLTVTTIISCAIIFIVRKKNR